MTADPIRAIASAIAIEEGFYVPGAKPQRLNNPGDLRAAPWLLSQVIEGGYVHFASVAQGIAGLYHQVALDVARGMTLRQLISKWAPPTENDTSAYLAAVASRTGLPLDQPLQELLTLDGPE
jgi:hypothetical protein